LSIDNGACPPVMIFDVVKYVGIGFARMKSNLLLVAAGLAAVGTAQKAKISKSRLSFTPQQVQKARFILTHCKKCSWATPSRKLLAGGRWYGPS